MSNFTEYNENTFPGGPNLGLEPNKPKKGALFILSVIFFALGFLIVCVNGIMNFIRNPQHNISYTIGYLLAFVIVCILIIGGLFLLATRVFKKNWILLLFSILYLMGAFSVFAINIVTISNERVINEAAKDKFISLCTSLNEGKDISGETFDKSEYGTLTPVLNLIQDYGTRFRALSADVSEDTNSMDLNQLLSSDTFTSTENINDAKKKLDDTSKIYDKYESEYNELMKDFETTASSLELPDSIKDGFLDGFKKSEKELYNNTSSFFKIEKDVFSNINNLLDFMISSKGNYVVQNNQILFTSNSDLDKFNNYIQDLEKLAQKEAEIQNIMRESQDMKLDRLDKFK